MASRILWLSVILCLQQLPRIHSAVSCTSESGEAVDWFIAYKLPELEESTHDYVRQGLGYVYMDSKNKYFTMPKKSIRNYTSAVGRTLDQIYRRQSLGYVMYNDENPAGHKTVYYGHSKGDLAFDKTSGFWLIHSVPKFPPFARYRYDYPESGERYGQTFICATFNFSTFNEIGWQLLYNGPQIYDYYLPDDLVYDVPNIEKAVHGKYIYSQPYDHVRRLHSIGNKTYTSFAKSKLFGNDLYSDLVAPYYNADLLAETWQNGEGKLPSNCSEPTVENILDVKLESDHFKESHDHSKWAISKSRARGLVCIGDINRMYSQFKRGGGTLCTTDVEIWSAFREATTSIDFCQNTLLPV